MSGAVTVLVSSYTGTLFKTNLFCSQMFLSFLYHLLVTQLLEQSSFNF